MLLEAFAIGNSKTSPFLHGTKDLQRCKNIRERRACTATGGARWPLTAEDAVIGLSNVAAQSQWLSEEGGDSDLTLEHLKTCRVHAERLIHDAPPQCGGKPEFARFAGAVPNSFSCDKFGPPTVGCTDARAPGSETLRPRRPWRKR